MSVSIRSGRVAVAAGVVVLALLLTAAPALAAGHIQSRFSVPAVNDPYDALSDENVHVDGSTVNFLSTDSSFAGDTSDGYRWTIGAPALTAFAPAADAVRAAPGALGQEFHLPGGTMCLQVGRQVRHLESLARGLPAEKCSQAHVAELLVMAEGLPVGRDQDQGIRCAGRGLGVHRVRPVGRVLIL